MKRYASLVAVLIALAVTSYSQETASEETTSHRWACWTAGKGALGKNLEQYFDHFNKPHLIANQGDFWLTPCRFDPLADASGIELVSDGTGRLLDGYGGFRREDRRVFRTDDRGRSRWSINEENVMTLLSESDSGVIRTRYWRIVESVGENIFRVTALQDDGMNFYWWRVGSPEDRALQEWRECRDRNKDKGFDAVPCENPVSASVASAGSD